MKDTVKKVVLLNHVGGGNLGDDATIDAILQNIRARWPEAEIHAITMNPEDTMRRHALPAYPIRTKTWSITESTRIDKVGAGKSLKTAFVRKGFLYRFCKPIYRLLVEIPRSIVKEVSFLLRAQKHLQSYDLLVIAGGGQLTERDGAWAFPYTLFKWTMLARFTKVRSIFLNLGVGPLSSTAGKLLSVQALKQADYVSFRDEKSQKLARSSGFTGKSYVFPDNVYGLDNNLATSAESQRAKELIVGFAPVPYGDPQLHPNEKDRVVYDTFLSKCTSIHEWLSANRYSVWLFGTDVGVDPPVNKQLLSAVRDQNKGGSLKDYNPQTVQEVLELMSRMDYIITCRFHGVIFAHLLNKPVVAIAHHPKVITLMNELGLGDYCVDIRDFDPVQVTDMFSSLVHNSHEVKASMSESLCRYRSELERQYDELFPPRSQEFEFNAIAGLCREAHFQS